VLHLDAGVHLHEVVAVPVDDALEGGGRIEADRLAELGGIFLHPFENFQVALQGLHLCLATGLLRLFDGKCQTLLGHGNLQQFLLVHLQGAVTAAEGNAPLAVADQLNLVVAGLLDVQLDQDVLVVADAVGLYFIEDFTHQGRRLGGCLLDLLVRRVLGRQQGGAEDPLPLAAAATNRFQADPAAGILPEHVLHFHLHLGGELLDGVEV